MVKYQCEKCEQAYALLHDALMCEYEHTKVKTKEEQEKENANEQMEREQDFEQMDRENTEWNENHN